MSQLGEPHIDVVLRPGDALYIPRGTIVATSTLGTQPQSILGAACIASMAHGCVLSVEPRHLRRDVCIVLLSLCKGF